MLQGQAHAQAWRGRASPACAAAVLPTTMCSAREGHSPPWQRRSLHVVISLNQSSFHWQVSHQPCYSSSTCQLAASNGDRKSIRCGQGIAKWHSRSPVESYTAQHLLLKHCICNSIGVTCLTANAANSQPGSTGQSPMQQANRQQNLWTSAHTVQFALRDSKSSS
jgi:hypothetical protein